MNNDLPAQSTAAPSLYAHVVLDRSGSMHSCVSDAVGGYNAYVAQLPPSTRVSLTLFDSAGIELVRDAVEPGQALLSEEEYVPRASTPLFDAIGHTVMAAEKRSKNFDRVALVILTDGLENASREFRRSDVLELLVRKQEQDGWLIIYLGAEQDAWAVGQTFGTAAPNTMSILKDNIAFALRSAGEMTNVFVSADDAQSGRRRGQFSRQQRTEAGKPARQ